MTRRIAIYGGSFDPFHLGHLVPVVRAQETFLFESVYFVPAGSPPHKNVGPLTPVTHRLAMVAMATLPYDNFFTSDDEVFAPQPTYSVETVRRFRERYPDSTFFFILGSDSFSQITSWEMWEELVDSVHLVVLLRAQMWGKELEQRVPVRLLPRLQLVEPFEEVPDPGELTIYLLNHEPFPISGTSIRNRQRRGLPIRELVPHEVHSYIEKYDLYSPASMTEE